MYENPVMALALSEGHTIPEEIVKDIVRHFEDFYEDIFLEVC